MQAKKLGYKGEDIAAHYLESKGYEILENNFQIRGGEIDLVAKRAGVFVFVEVKTRTQNAFGLGEESVTSLKRRRIHRAIERYCDKKLAGRIPDYRIDLIEIRLGKQDNAVESVNHFEDIEL